MFDSAAENLADAGKKIVKEKKKNLKFDNLLLCFDDLERIDPEYLTENEILGFINSLVEYDNNKVIIIANETKIDSEVFVKIKEKTIGHTLYFDQDFFEALSNILNSDNYSDSFKEYLDKHKHEIHQILQNPDKSINYRTLKYFITCFSTIHANITVNGFKAPALEERLDEIIYDIMLFTLGVATEYKKGEISYENNMELSNQQSLIVAMMWNKSGDLETYASKFLKTYFPVEARFYYYKNIYNFITGGDIFDIDKLKYELKDRYNIKGDEIPEHYKIYNRLLNHDYLLIEDGENKKLLRKLRDGALSGRFLPSEYPGIFYIIARDGNILNLNLDKLTNKFLTVIKRIRNKHTYHPLMSQYMTTDKNNPFFDQFNRMRTVLLEINQATKHNNRAQGNKELVKLIKQDFDAFYQQTIDSESDNKIYMSFEGFSPSLLSNIFSKLTNKQKQSFIFMIYRRYVDKQSSSLIDDLSLLESLKEKIDSKISKGKLKNNSGMLYKELRRTLEKAIDSIQNFPPSLFSSNSF